MRGGIVNYIAIIRDDSKERSALLEKETLLKEINHRVKNNMQIVASPLFLAAESETDERVRKPLLASKDRIASMALVHEALYGTVGLSTLDMSEYLSRLLGDLTAAYAPSAVRVVTDLQPVVLDAKFAVHCGLIVTELFSNVLKHAFPGGSKGEVRVGMKEEASVFRTISTSRAPPPWDCAWSGASPPRCARPSISSGVGAGRLGGSPGRRTPSGQPQPP